MSSTSQHRSVQVINTALEGAKFVRRTTENVALLDPLKAPANTLIAILECTRVLLVSPIENIELTFILGCKDE
jgi:hypothetical protein